MKQDIKFVYFDIGGVFLEWEKAFTTAANKFGVDIDEMVDLYDGISNKITLGKMTPDEFWSLCVDKFNIQDADNFDFADSWVGDYVPIKPMHKLAESISKIMRVGIISNFFEGMYPLTIEKGYVPDLDYDPIIISCDTGMKKPESNIFTYAQKLIGLESIQILFIDDLEKNVEAAKKMGWEAIQFDTNKPFNSIEEIQSILDIKK